MEEKLLSFSLPRRANKVDQEMKKNMSSILRKTDCSIILRGWMMQHIMIVAQNKGVASIRGLHTPFQMPLKHFVSRGMGTVKGTLTWYSREVL